MLHLTIFEKAVIDVVQDAFYGFVLLSHKFFNHFGFLLAPSLGLPLLLNHYVEFGLYLLDDYIYFVLMAGESFNYFRQTLCFTLFLILFEDLVVL
jgi:hypothetical protein